MQQTIIGLAGEKFSGKNTSAGVLIDNFNFKEFSLARPLKELCASVFDLPYEHWDDFKLKENKFQSGPKAITQDHIYEIVRLCSNLIGFDQFRKNEETILKNMSKRVVKKVSMNPAVPKVQMVQTPNGLQQQYVNPMFLPKEYKTFDTPRQILQFVGTELVRDCISPYFWCKVLDTKIKNEEHVVVTDVRFAEEREYVRIKKGLLIKVERNSQEDTKPKDGHSSENSLGANNEYNYLLSNDGTVEELKERLQTIYLYENFLANRKINRIDTQEA